MVQRQVPKMKHPDSPEDSYLSKVDSNQVLRKAERLFLQSNYRQALSLCNRYFQEHRKDKESAPTSKESSKQILLTPLMSIHQLALYDRNDELCPRNSFSPRPRRWCVNLPSDNDSSPQATSSNAAILLDYHYVLL